MKLTIQNITKITGTTLNKHWSIYDCRESAGEYEFFCVNLLDGNFRKLVLIREASPQGYLYFTREVDVSRTLWTKSDPYTFEDFSSLYKATHVLSYEIDFAHNVTPLAVSQNYMSHSSHSFQST